MFVDYGSNGGKVDGNVCFLPHFLALLTSFHFCVMFRVDERCGIGKWDGKYLMLSLNGCFVANTSTGLTLLSH